MRDLPPQEILLEMVKYQAFKRFILLLFATALLMWYMFEMINIVIDTKLVVAETPIPASNSGILLIILPAIINSLAWLVGATAWRVEDEELRHIFEGDAGRLFIRRRIFGRAVDLLITVQILYIWLSIVYIYVFALP